MLPAVRDSANDTQPYEQINRSIHTHLIDAGACSNDICNAHGLIKRPKDVEYF